MLENSEPTTFMQVLVFKLWDKDVPIAFFGGSEPLIPLKIVGEMFNVDYEGELDKLIEANTYVFQQIEYIRWVDPEVSRILGHTTAPWIPLSVVPLWLAGTETGNFRDGQALQTVHFVLMRLFSHPAATYGAGAGDSLLALRPYAS
ncbi:MAG: hypothetical protein HND51_11525 [Chloroflexi bacterium]|nr:hypothetical protein [Chloroflexota bacterium]